MRPNKPNHECIIKQPMAVWNRCIALSHPNAARIVLIQSGVLAGNIWFIGNNDEAEPPLWEGGNPANQQEDNNEQQRQTQAKSDGDPISFG